MLFGLYCIMRGVVASFYATSLRVGSAFAGVLFLLPLLYKLMIHLTEREEIAQTVRWVGTSLIVLVLFR